MRLIVDADCPVLRKVVPGPRGEIVPCTSLPVVLGNIRRHRLREVWENHPFLAHLRGLTQRDLGPCAACPRSGYCVRCPGVALLENGDLCGRSAFSCAQAEAKERAVATTPISGSAG